MQIGWFAHPVFSEGGDYPPVMRERVMSNSLAEGLSRSRLPTFTLAEVAALKGVLRRGAALALPCRRGSLLVIRSTDWSAPPFLRLAGSFCLRQGRPTSSG